MIINIIVGLAIAATVYLGFRVIANYLINTRYLSEQSKSERLAEHIENLQDFARKNNISSEDTDKIAYWAKQNPYVYLMVYKNNVLFFSSDMNDDKDDTASKPESDPGDKGDGDSSKDPTEDGTPGADKPEGEQKPGSGTSSDDGGGAEDNKNDSSEDKSDGKNDNKNESGGFGSLGIGSNKIDRETLIKQAEASGMHSIELTDGIIFAEIADYSETLYLSLSNILSLVAGIIVFVVILIVYFRKIVFRLKKLESDVNIISHINMNHSIVCEGKDEISMLSRNVENMRNTILDHLAKERAARAANTELVTAMSHDIRTPLTVLLGYIDIMKNSDGVDDTVKSYLGATEKTAMRLKELSDDMFKYSLAYGSTEQQINLEKYDAGMLMEQLFFEHILLLTDSGYEVKFDKPLDGIEDGATVYTDPQNLMRIIDNLFQNIQKYAKKDEPVIFSFYVEKERVRFVIKNTISDKPSGAESNEIGLKTCKRLAQYVAEDFSYENDGKYFTVSLSLKLDNHKQKGKK